MHANLFTDTARCALVPVYQRYTHTDSHAVLAGNNARCCNAAAQVTSAQADVRNARTLADELRAANERAQDEVGRRRAVEAQLEVGMRVQILRIFYRLCETGIPQAAPLRTPEGRDTALKVCLNAQAGARGPKVSLGLENIDKHAGEY